MLTNIVADAILSQTVTTVTFAGPPLVAPNGISISADDKLLYVADTSAGLFKLAVSGSSPQLITGTTAIHPRGVDVVGVLDQRAERLERDGRDTEVVDDATAEAAPTPAKKVAKKAAKKSAKK